MATERTFILVRHKNGSPALWLDEVRTELLHDNGSRSVDYYGSTLNDDNTSVPFDPATEDLDLAVEDWKRNTNPPAGEH